MSQTRKGCITCLLILDRSCNCIIQYHSTTLFPQYSRCGISRTNTEIKYPNNLMVAKLMVAEKDLQHIHADTLSDTPPSLLLPPLKIYTDEIAKGVAADKQDDLDLQKVLENLQKDQTSYTHLADELYDTHIQPIYSRVSLSVQFLPWLNLALAVSTHCLMLYLFWRLRVLSAAIALQAVHTRAYMIDQNLFTQKPAEPTEWYHPVVVNPTPHTATLIMVIVLLLLAWCFHDIIAFGLEKIKWSKNFTVFAPSSPKWDVVLQIAHKSALITVYVGPVPVLLTDFTAISQNAIARVKVVTMIPGIIYKLSIVQPEGALLRKNSILWQTPSSTHVGYPTANRIKSALRQPPVRYRLLLGQDGIFKSPPLHIPRVPHPDIPLPTYVIETETENRFYDQSQQYPSAPPSNPTNSQLIQFTPPQHQTTTYKSPKHITFSTFKPGHKSKTKLKSKTKSPTHKTTIKL